MFTMQRATLIVDPSASCRIPPFSIWTRTGAFSSVLLNIMLRDLAPRVSRLDNIHEYIRSFLNEHFESRNSTFEGSKFEILKAESCWRQVLRCAQMREGSFRIGVSEVTGVSEWGCAFVDWSLTTVIVWTQLKFINIIAMLHYPHNKPCSSSS